MASWIYVFAKFTPEALLFEALIICLLFAGYAAFWILRKRKYGVLGQETPAYAIKSYLSQLIGDAEQMRLQLFGLLAGAGIDPDAMAALRAASTTGNAHVSASAMLAATGDGKTPAAALAADPGMAAKLQALEAKMADQAKAMESITSEKTRVEKELTEIRSKGGGGPAVGTSIDAELKKKVQALEAKLAEYSVIEDDLANLKRLQQENTQLKAQLGGKTGTPVEPSASTPVSPASPEMEAATLSETALTEPPAMDAANEAAAKTAADVTDPNPAEAIAAATADPAFEGLVDQVERSLADAPAGATTTDPAKAASPAAAEAPRTAAAPPAGNEKSDADLVAEFEKMLNS